MSMFLIMLVCSGGVLDNALQTPPGDLASLLTPTGVLESLQTPMDEDALIEITSQGRVEAPGMDAIRKAAKDLGAADFRTRKAARDTLREAGPLATELLQEAAKSDDPEVRLSAQELLRDMAGKAQARDRGGDSDYVKRLFAIRALGDMKSQKAVPALKLAVKDTDATIRDAARSALAAIAGKPLPRPDARKLLASMATRLPHNLSLVAMLDLTSGAKPITLGKVFEMMTEAAGQQPAQPRMPFGRGIERMLNQMQPRSYTGLRRLIGTAGNMRVDAVTMIISDNWSFEDEDNPTAYIAWIFQGLCSPERLTATLTMNTRLQKRALPGGQTVLYDRHDFGICILDANAVIWAIGPGAECLYMDRIVKELHTERNAPTPALITNALTLMRPEGTRLALAALPDTFFAPEFLPEAHKQVNRQTDRIRNRKDLEKRPGTKVELASFELLLPALAASSITGHLDAKGAVELKAKCADADATKKLNAALTGMKTSLDDYFAVTLKRMGPEAVKTFEADLKGKWWTTKTAGDVTLTGNIHTVPKAMLLTLQAAMGGGFRPMPIPMPMPMPMHPQINLLPVPKR